MLAAFVALGCGGSTESVDAPTPAPCPPPGDGAGDGAGGASDGAGGAGGASDVPSADVSGDYTVTLTNVENTCSTFTSWVDGAVMTDIHYDIRQTDSDITGAAQGNAAFDFITLTGSNAFTGTVNGDAFTLTDVGPTVTKSGTCSYTVNAVVTGSIDGDSISGTLVYHPVLSADPACNADCAPFACHVEQSFEGSRAAN